MNGSRTSNFEDLQENFLQRHRLRGHHPFLVDEGTLVVLPSISFDVAELRKISGILHYEERLLFLLLLLANPRLRVVYLTSLPVDEAIVEYYLSFLPDPAGARARLDLLAVHDPVPRPLTAKLLERPRVLGRIRELTGGDANGYVLPFNVTALEWAFAEAVWMPLYGPRPDLIPLASKSGSRRAARLAGVPLVEGLEDIWSLDDVERAVRDLRARRSRGSQAVVVKLNDGFSGQGSAVIDASGLAPTVSALPTIFGAPEESWPSFGAKIAAMGAVVEELVEVPGTASPSVQARITPDGGIEVVSTHEQVLGGPRNQVYLGCRFPADRAYREPIQRHGRRVAEVLAERGVVGWLGVDFLAVPVDGRREVFMIEVNLRLGGTTHPFWMATLATGGSYHAATGELLAGGRAKHYRSTDNLVAKPLLGHSAAEVIARLARHGLLLDPAAGTGTTLHLLGALPDHGKLGITCIADSAAAADALFGEVVGVLASA